LRGLYPSGKRELFFKVYQYPKELVDYGLLLEENRAGWTYGYENQQIFCMPLWGDRIAIEA